MDPDANSWRPTVNEVAALLQLCTQKYSCDFEKVDISPFPGDGDVPQVWLIRAMLDADDADDHKNTSGEQDSVPRCSFRDGSWPSFSYPCSCGDAVCEEPGARCFADRSKCHVECSDGDGISPNAVYPCVCGLALCQAAEACNETSSACTPLEAVRQII